MALAAGFEPANPFELPVFKTGGLNQTLPSKQVYKSCRYKTTNGYAEHHDNVFRRKSNQNTNIEAMVGILGFEPNTGAAYKAAALTN